MNCLNVGSKNMVLILIILLLHVQTKNFQQHGQLKQTGLDPHSSSVIKVHIARESSFIVTGASQTTLKKWNFTSLSLIASHTYSDIIISFSVNPNDLRIFVGLDDGTISILDGTTFLQITSYTYPNSGKAYVITLPTNQDQYYTGGSDVTVPMIHNFNSTDQTQIDTGVTTSFNSGSSIIAMDCYFNMLQNILALSSNQNVAPFRMIIYNVNTQVSTNHDEAGGQIKFVKFCNTGQTVFTASADNMLRMYKINTELKKYTYAGSFNTISYGTPSSISCETEQNVVISAGQYLLMLNIEENSIKLFNSYLVGTSNVHSMHQLHNMIVAGCQDGSVKLIKVKYPDHHLRGNMNTVIINGSILSGIVLLGLIIAIYNIIIYKADQIINQSIAPQEVQRSSSSDQIPNQDDLKQKKISTPHQSTQKKLKMNHEGLYSQPQMIEVIKKK